MREILLLLKTIDKRLERIEKRLNSIDKLFKSKEVNVSEAVRKGVEKAINKEGSDKADRVED